MGKKGISRREFLKGTAASALGVAALGLLGGCAAENEPTVNEPCPTAESAADDWLGQEPQIDAEAIKETLETEVLVVGAGTGGMFAACSAAENGAKVLVVEKYPTGGGIRDDLGAINSRLRIQFQCRSIKHHHRMGLIKFAPCPDAGLNPITGRPRN